MTSKRLEDETDGERPEGRLPEGDVKGDFNSEEFPLPVLFPLPAPVLFPLPVLPVSGSGVTDSDPASVLVAGNDELPYKFSVHEYLKKDDKYLILTKILE